MCFSYFLKNNIISKTKIIEKFKTQSSFFKSGNNNNNEKMVTKIAKYKRRKTYKLKHLECITQPQCIDLICIPNKQTTKTKDKTIVDLWMRVSYLILRNYSCVFKKYIRKYLQVKCYVWNLCYLKWYVWNSRTEGSIYRWNKMGIHWSLLKLGGSRSDFTPAFTRKLTNKV